MKRRIILGIFTALLLAPALSHAQQGNYPTRQVRIIVPYPPGGPTDLIARLVAQKLGERLGQPLVVDNRPGASGTLGTQVVAHAAPDGYTLGLANTSTLTV